MRDILFLSFTVEALVDRRDLLDPAPPLRMFQLHDPFERPVEVERDEGYLLVERFEGVA
jgi:hypothetical protein